MSDIIAMEKSSLIAAITAEVAPLKEHIAALEARCAALLADVNQDEGYERLKAELQSIASNTCCDKCQEAALVARRALGLTLETACEHPLETMNHHGFVTGIAEDFRCTLCDLVMPLSKDEIAQWYRVHAKTKGESNG